MRIIMILIIIVLAIMAYIRLAPVDVARWHMLPDDAASGDDAQMGSYRVVRRTIAPDAVVLELLFDAARTTPRTRMIAGSIEEGMMTFETRSQIWGFPDYTTIAMQGDVLVIYGRLRFGRSDMGVNKARMEDWLEAVAPLTEPL